MKTCNPFITSGYAGPETFCDRERETSELLSGLENGRNVTLIAPRRYGKTGLIRNAMNALPKGLPFSGEAFAGLYRRFEGITWYVQSVLNRIWQKGAGFRNDEDVEEAVGSLVDNRDLVFHDLLRSQGVAARSVLRAAGGAFIGRVATERGRRLRRLRRGRRTSRTRRQWPGRPLPGRRGRMRARE